MKHKLKVTTRESAKAIRPEPIVVIEVPLHAAIALGWILGETTGSGLADLYDKLLAVAEDKLGVESLWRHQEHGLSHEELETNHTTNAGNAEAAAKKVVEKAGLQVVELVSSYD